MSAADKRRILAAANTPVCGYSDSTSATRIKGVPIWSFCGDQETAPLLENNRMMAKALMQAGASARFEEYPGVAHNAWDKAYGTAESYTWFLEHSIPALSTVIVSVIPR